MSVRRPRFAWLLSVGLCVGSATQLAAQIIDHSKMSGMDGGTTATPAGSAAFAVITDIVKKLKADPNTDWAKVNIEALRKHLIDMDDVIMHASAKVANVDGGVQLDITGAGKVAAAIRRMGSMHATALSDEGEYAARASNIAGGVRMVVTAKAAADSKAVARLRGLGFAGIFAEGDHHAMHHMMIARGEQMMHGRK